MTRGAGRRAPVRCVAAVVAAVVGQGLTAAPAHAEDCAVVAWTGPSGGSWTDPANWSTGSAPGATSAVTVSGAAVTDVAGAVCSLALDGADLSLTGSLQATTTALGAGTVLHRPEGASGDGPQLRVGTGLTVAGDGVGLRDVGLAVDPSGQVALDGRVLALTGTGLSSLGSGVTVGDASAGGTGVLEVGQSLTTGSALSLTGGARLRLVAGAALSASTTTLSGTGSLAWRAGTVAGDLTLTVGASIDTTEAKALLGALHVGAATTTRLAGAVTVAGTLDVSGTLLAVPGSTLTGSGGSAVTNPGAVLRVDVTPPGGTSAPVTLDGLPLSGSGTVVVSPGERLSLSRTGWSADSPALTASSLAAGTALRGGGALRVGAGAVLALSGPLGITEGTVLELDDGGDGSGARLDAAGATLLGPPKSNGSTDATFRWRSGVVRGQLTVEGPGTEIGSLSTSSGGATRRLQPLDESARARLLLRGPLSLQAARVLVAPRSDALLAGESKLGAAAGFTYDGTGTPDATVTVTPTGSIKLAPVSISGLTIPSAGVFDVPLLNQGYVELNASSLSATAGYTQSKPEGSTTDPSTAIYTALQTGDSPPPPSTLTAGTAQVAINGGVLFGRGTVKTARLVIGPAALIPGFRTEPGTLTVEGDLALSPQSDLQVTVGGTTASTYDHLDVTGSAALDGRLTALTKDGYTPAYLSTAPSVLTAKSLAGTFATSAWTPTSTGLGFKPTYTATAVDLAYVDVAPPALGLAGIPAVTLSSTQRITFAGVDNKTGVAGFDVRYRRSNATSVGGWAYPGAWQNQRASYTDHVGLAAGWTYCYSVRARDKAGNVTGWSTPLCTTRMADDRTAVASGSWTRPGGVNGFYGSTFSRTTSLGSYLRVTGTSTRVAVTALRCPSCGLVDVYLGSTRLGRIDLRSATSALRTWTSAAYPARAGTVYVRTITSGRPVVIDAVALQRVPPA